MKLNESINKALKNKFLKENEENMKDILISNLHKLVSIKLPGSWKNLCKDQNIENLANEFFSSHRVTIIDGKAVCIQLIDNNIGAPTVAISFGHGADAHPMVTADDGDQKDFEKVIADFEAVVAHAEKIEESLVDAWDELNSAGLGYWLAYRG